MGDGTNLMCNAYTTHEPIGDARTRQFPRLFHGVDTGRSIEGVTQAVQAAASRRHFDRPVASAHVPRNRLEPQRVRQSCERKS